VIKLIIVEVQYTRRAEKLNQCYFCDNFAKFKITLVIPSLFSGMICILIKI